MDNKKLAYIGAGALLLWFMLKPKTADAKAPPVAKSRDSGPPVAPGAGGGAVADKEVTQPAEPPTQGRTSVKRGEGWSQIAKRLYGDYRWWPMLWDLNRSPTMYPTPEEGLVAGATVIAPVSLPTDPVYSAAILQRADLYSQWYKKSDAAAKAGRRPIPVPIFVTRATPIPGTGTPVYPAVPAGTPSETNPNVADPCAGMVNDREIVVCRYEQAQNDLDSAFNAAIAN